MNGLGEFTNISQNLERIARYLYGSARTSIEVPIDEIKAEFSDIGHDEIENVLQRLQGARLVQISQAGNMVRLLPAGKMSHSDGCVSELVLGAQFIRAKYRSSVVHIIVRNQLGDESGGTGFFVAEPLNHIVTARHLFEAHTLARVEAPDGASIAVETNGVHLAPGRLDLAVIKCTMPTACTPFRIDWREDSVEELDEVLIFGYPPFAGHNVALSFLSTKVTALPGILGEPGKHSIMIPRLAAPGCSGGPVVSDSGLVIAVLSTDNIFDRVHPPQFTSYVSATPACYLRELAS